MILGSWPYGTRSSGNPSTTHIEPMVGMACSASDLAAQGTAGAAALEAIASGRRFAFFRHFLEQDNGGRPDAAARPLRQIVRGGWNTAEHEDNLAAILDAYKAAGGPTPDFVILENEDGHSYFRLGNATQRADAILALTADEQLAAMLPPEVRALTRSDIENFTASTTGRARLGYIAWHAIDNAWKRNALSVFSRVWTDTFGTPPPPTSNYASSRMGRRWLDESGYPYTVSSETPFSLSSPPCYPQPRVVSLYTARPAMWHNFLAICNRLLAIDGAIFPWVDTWSVAGNTGRVRDSAKPVEYMLRVCAELGTSHGALFNSTETTAQRETLELILDGIPVKAGLTSVFDKPEPVDVATATSITIGDYTVEYVEAEWTVNNGQWS